MNRHVKSLQRKTRRHKCNIYTSEWGQYWVESGGSGKVYDVRYTNRHNRENLAPVCSCSWQEYNPGSLCSHGLALIEWLDGRTVSVWTNEADAKRQHKPISTVIDPSTGEVLFLTWR